MQYITAEAVMDHLYNNVGLPPDSCTLFWFRDCLRNGTGPRHIRPSPRKALFLQSDIDEWVAGMERSKAASARAV